MVQPLPAETATAGQPGQLAVGRVQGVAEDEQGGDQKSDQGSAGASASTARPENVKTALTAVTWLGVRPTL